ncbi:hypothetical protein NADFUDRAFT_49038 [Nadsonia fulvescens var. elongata DSM 6958]|uniref:Regulator of G protein signaling superfamily n=1 Tax=Nadsonia fulvescens var. elongata DSM 6958 TaxID=857566 RepID=A0A1E3PT02_9ASCO|nr:hypothetical protein NADFUDRAFT_49038 [Nadsonia fulvescens var. elongata DSM 6958]
MSSNELFDIFSMLMLSLPLNEEGVKLGFLSKTYPYSFTIHQAISVMENLSLSIDNGSMSTIITCEIGSDTGLALLEKFLSAKLIHCPADRTRDSPKASVALQPTSKGIHILQKYYQRNGHRCPHITELLLSPLNSMRCITLNRSVTNDKIIQSEYFIHLLFQKFIGNQPNIYSPNNLPDSIPKNTLASIYGGISDFSVNSPDSAYFRFGIVNDVSPYFHRYFTHPDSDSVTQYYVSSKGVRLFRKKNFSNGVTEECFTGKAAWQWIMECCEIVNPGEAQDIGNLFLSHKLIEPITPSLSNKNNRYLAVSKKAFFRLTVKGKILSGWESSNNSCASLVESIPSRNGYQVSNFSNVSLASTDIGGGLGGRKISSVFNDSDSLTRTTLKTVLEDPGLALLFREYLGSHYCIENLLFYYELHKFSLQYGPLLSSKPRSEKLPNWVKPCFSNAFTIYNGFLAQGAPFELNIDHKLRTEIIQVMSNLTDKPNNLQKLQTLHKIFYLFERAKKNVYRMMATDSLPNFLISKSYQESVLTFCSLKE